MTVDVPASSRRVENALVWLFGVENVSMTSPLTRLSSVLGSLRMWYWIVDVSCVQLNAAVAVPSAVLVGAVRVTFGLAMRKS